MIALDFIERENEDPFHSFRFGHETLQAIEIRKLFDATDDVSLTDCFRHSPISIVIPEFNIFNQN
ncbi:hypothetical protein [Stappia sp. ES.058]|uniref:hypothetical protein n=1 Tax=Stappia sp. ES.058 TaxID=1881061 RepID=UPI0012FD8765|nr:hypothetical protein [Stappia sp. ES.058]